MTTPVPQWNRYYDNTLEWRPGEVVTLFESLDFERVGANDLGGYFGKVFLVQELNHKIRMIAKSVGERKDQVDKINAIEAFKREAYALLNLPPHPNIVQSFIVHRVKRNDYIFMEHVDGGNLLEYIEFCKKESKKKTLNDLYPIIYQMAEGLRFIHSNEFVHKDLKHDNILITYDTHNFPIV